MLPLARRDLGLTRSRPLHHSWRGLGGLRAVMRERQRLAPNNEGKSPRKPPLQGGAKMTAEVAILNKSAVALAADSKVTIGFGGSEKTYDSVNKIFTLSKRHPVGCMIYGNADFMQYPWETIIKLYRKERADHSEDTIAAYGRSFLSFVRRFKKFKQADIEENVINLLRSIFAQVTKQAQYEADIDRVDIPSPEYDRIFLNRVGYATQEVIEGRAWANKVSAKSILAKYSKSIGGVVSEYVPNRKNNKLVDASITLAALALTHNYYSPQLSGLVIAGFGEKEIFPSVISYETDGYVGSQMKISEGHLVQTTTMNSSGVLAFAQHDIAYRFMEGIDPGYSNFIQGLVKTSLTQTNLKVFEKWAPKSKQTAKTKKEIEKAAQKAFDDIVTLSKRYRILEFSSPTTDMISILPKDELAHVAESLLALTSLHRRISRDVETVGGPIDVAVISKGDGFIWLKRKHYFRSELNPHFAINYMRDAGA